MRRFSYCFVVLTLIHSTAWAQGPKAKEGRKETEVASEWVVLTERASSVDERVHRDFPDLAVDGAGVVWVNYVEHDGVADRLWLGRKDGGRLVPVVEVSAQAGVMHQPAIAVDGDGGVWSFWGQTNAADVVTLRGRVWREGELGEELELAASAEGGSSFADATTAGDGRVWVTWQEVRPGSSRVWARGWVPGAGWSAAVKVSAGADGGHWEPRVVGAPDGSAWVVYDSSAGSEFNLCLAQVKADGVVVPHSLPTTADYEARASLTMQGGETLWIAAERGRQQWGLDSRGHENEMGLNAQKRLMLGRFDIGTGEWTEVAVPDHGRPTPAPAPSPGYAVNVPSVVVALDKVWMSYRYFMADRWQVAVICFDPADDGGWSEPLAVPDSTMGQDRHQELLALGGKVHLTWASDLRTTKQCGIAGVYTACVDTAARWPAHPDARPLEVACGPEPKPYLEEPTPPRALDDHHVWTVGGTTYRLLWGDLHRHTDISNCRTGFDGCILEAYRYAYDLAGLDFLGTSDHTDIGKIYDPYEWWHTQRQVDVFHAPGTFASLYAYEREQRFPWGHRNIVFAKRGGPIWYINRATYRRSPWQQALPVKAGVGEILPVEVWELVKRHGEPCAIISHTGATGMGTDWTRYEGPVDNTNENLVEIFQGARVSYEGVGLPQPTVGLREGEAYTPHRQSTGEHAMPPGVITDFDAGFKSEPGYNKGTYQSGLRAGHKLGVFASSDHISTHTSFGGVYVKAFTREGILEGFNARRTCAATDKIFIQLGSGDRLMGEVFSAAGAVTLEGVVRGTAALRRVTVVRNEEDWHEVELVEGERDLELTWTDAQPMAGENRYYLRIEQVDGNMGWSSPMWIWVGN